MPGRTVRLVREAKERNLFKKLPAGRVKSDALLLLELCVLPRRRAEALHALEELGGELRDMGKRERQAMAACVGLVNGARLCPTKEELRREAKPPRPHEAQRVRELQNAAAAKKPYVFKPPTTVAGDPDRHPWHGLVARRPSFTEFATGVGMFAACFQEAGAQVVCMIEPRNEAMALARQNVPGVNLHLDSVFDVDPVDLPWSHGIGGGPECQPFSVAGQQRAWADNRAYTLLRSLHIAAVMQPWWCWIENVRALETVQGGRVWRLVQDIAQMVGFKIRLSQE